MSDDPVMRAMNSPVGRAASWIGDRVFPDRWPTVVRRVFLLTAPISFPLYLILFVAFAMPPLVTLLMAEFAYAIALSLWQKR
jgi:hypothetical protein